MTLNELAERYKTEVRRYWDARCALANNAADPMDHDIWKSLQRETELAQVAMEIAYTEYRTELDAEWLSCCKAGNSESKRIADSLENIAKARGEASE